MKTTISVVGPTVDNRVEAGRAYPKNSCPPPMKLTGSLTVRSLMSMLSSFDLLMINLCSDCKLYTNFKLETKNKPFHDFPYR